MENTKFDLSFDEIKIDYNATVNVALMSVRCLKSSLERVKREVEDSFESENSVSSQISANELKRIAKDFATAVEVYCKLKEGTKRTKKIIINCEV